MFFLFLNGSPEMHIVMQVNETNTKNYFFKKGRCYCTGKLTIMYLFISMCEFYFTYVVLTDQEATEGVTKSWNWVQLDF